VSGSDRSGEINLVCLRPAPDHRIPLTNEHFVDCTGSALPGAPATRRVITERGVRPLPRCVTSEVQRNAGSARSGVREIVRGGWRSMRLCLCLSAWGWRRAAG
jgi:hypothetical protein